MATDDTGHGHFVVVGAQRCGTTYLRTLLDEHPGITMAAAASPGPKPGEPKVFLSDEVVGRGHRSYDADVVLCRAAGCAAGREEHQLSRGAGDDRPDPSRARRRPGPGAAARPGRPRGVELAAEHGARPGDPATGAGAGREPRGPARLGSRHDVGVAVRLSGARPLRRAAGAVAARVRRPASRAAAGGPAGRADGDPADVCLARSSSRSSARRPWASRSTRAGSRHPD